MRAIFISVGFFCIVSSVWAADTSLRVGVVNVQRILDESIAGKAAKNDLAALLNKSRLKMDLLKKDLERERDVLDKQASLLSESALLEKRDNYIKHEREYRATLQDEQTAIGRAQEGYMRKLIEGIDKWTKKIAEERQIDAVLEYDTDFVIYADNKVDLTTRVLDAVNDELTN